MSGTSHVAQKGMKKNLSGKKSKKKLVQKWNKKKRPKKTELESQEIAQLEIKLKQVICGMNALKFMIHDSYSWVNL